MLQSLPQRGLPLAAALLVCLALACAPMPQAGTDAAETMDVIETPDGILRLHVIANSDSEADQAVKLLVRDEILARMEPGGSAAEAEAFVRTHGAELLAAAEDVLRDNGFSYGAQLMLGAYDFPDRTYGGTLYPAGTYRALRVVLGDGAGQNWWCVLFPPLCIVTGEAQALPAADELTFRSSLLDWLRGLGVFA